MKNSTSVLLSTCAHTQFSPCHSFLRPQFFKHVCISHPPHPPKRETFTHLRTRLGCFESLSTCTAPDGPPLDRMDRFSSPASIEGTRIMGSCIARPCRAPRKRVRNTPNDQKKNESPKREGMLRNRILLAPGAVWFASSHNAGRPTLGIPIKGIRHPGKGGEPHT